MGMYSDRYQLSSISSSIADANVETSMEIWSTTFIGDAEHENKTYNISVTGSATEDEVVVELAAENDGGCCGSVRQTKTVSNFSVAKWDPGSAHFVNCLLASGAATLASELAKCQQKYGFRPILIIECMRDKGHMLEPALTSALVSCWIAGSF